MSGGRYAWSEDQDIMLGRLYYERVDLQDIADALGKSLSTITRRLDSLNPGYVAAVIIRCPRCHEPLLQSKGLVYCIGCGHETPESRKVTASVPMDSDE